MKAVIVDDEADARAIIAQFLTKFCKEVTEIHRASNVAAAVQLIDENEPELLFLDINMRDETGFDVLEAVTYKGFEVIFTTAYKEHALKAIKASAFDYLLKPINPLELQKTVARAAEAIHSKQELQNLKDTIATFKIERVGLPLKNRIELTNINDIIRLQAEANYTHVYLKNGEKVLIAKTLKSFEALLNNKNFIRVHQSHIINVDAVVRFDAKEKILLLKTEEEVPVSRRFKTLVVDCLSMKIISK